MYCRIQFSVGFDSKAALEANPTVHTCGENPDFGKFNYCLCSSCSGRGNIKTKAANAIGTKKTMPKCAQYCHKTG